MLTELNRGRRNRHGRRQRSGAAEQPALTVSSTKNPRQLPLLLGLDALSQDRSAGRLGVRVPLVGREAGLALLAEYIRAIHVLRADEPPMPSLVPLTLSLAPPMAPLQTPTHSLFS